MIKKLISICLTFIIMFSAAVYFIPTDINMGIQAYADDSKVYHEGDFDYVILMDNTAKIIKYYGSERDLIIPALLGGVKVTVIEDYTFSNCSNLCSVKISNSVIKISDGTFYNCADLIYIEIPDSVTSIGDYAFYGCSSLTDIAIPDSVTSIGSSAFSYCSSLTVITIPDNLTSIGSSAFYKTAWYINQGDGVVYLNNWCIIYKDDILYYNDISSLLIEEGIKGIADGAFMGCGSLTNITLPSSLMYIGNKAFTNCKNLSGISMSDNVISIGRNILDSTAWYKNQEDGLLYLNNWCIGYKGRHDFDTITIKNGIIGIADNAFIDYYSYYQSQILNKILLPESLLYIGAYSFANSSIKSITLPPNVKKIGNKSLGYNVCTDLNSYYADIIEDFKIYCFSGTAGETYAIENGFEYEVLNNVSIAVAYDATAKTVTIAGSAPCVQVVIKITKENETDPVYLGYENVVDGKYTKVLPASTYSEGTYTVSVENIDNGNIVTAGLTITDDTGVPVITIGQYNTNPTNQSITVTATINKGSLNAASHTFTENGSFEFVATDAAGNVTKQTVTITNIDKNAPVVSGVMNNAFYNTNKSITFNEGTGTLNGIAFASGGSATKEGLNKLTVTDAAGNSTTIQFTIDKTKPVITVKDTGNKAVTNNSTVYGDIIVSYSDINIKGITVKKGTATTAYPSNGKFTTDGKYTITATDKAGNTASITFTINKTKPVITAKTSSGSVLNNAYVNKSVTVTVNGYNVTKAVTKDGKSYKYPSNGIFTASGKYVITAKSGTNVSTFIFTIDTVKPAISSQSVTNNGYTKSNVTIVIKETNLSTKTVTKNGAKFTYPSNGLFTAEGKYVITVKDKAGNTVIFTFTIDKKAPKITVKNSSGTVITNNSSVSRSASITVTETNISAKTITKNGTKISWPSTNSVTSRGLYSITVTDKAGNKSTFTFRVV